MPGMKIDQFLGKQARLASELTKTNLAQEAVNLKLYSGQLQGMLEPYPLANRHEVTLGSTTIYKHYAGSDNSGDFEFLGFTPSESDGFVSIVAADNDTLGLIGAIYYTGDGFPKFRTFGGDSHPIGLPLPEGDPLVLTVTSRASVNISRVNRAGNRAVVTTSTNHEFRTGLWVSIYFSGTSGGDQQQLETAQALIQVNNDTQFSYRSVGKSVSGGAGTATLSGNEEPRYYNYTWTNSFGAESVVSKAQDIDNAPLAVSGQKIKISGIPQEGPPPDGDRNWLVTGLNIYRSLSTAKGNRWFLLYRLRFPLDNSSFRLFLEDEVLKLEFPKWPHFLLSEDRLLFVGGNGAQTELVVDKALDLKTVEIKTGPEDLVGATGKLYFNAQPERLTMEPVWWGLDSYDLEDTHPDFVTTQALQSLQWSPPPENMQGLVRFGTDILLGFSNQYLVASETNFPQAFPAAYWRAIGEEIVALASSSGYALVLTKGFPYQVSGRSPTSLEVTKLDVQYPCIAPESVVVLEQGIMYATDGGLAMYRPGGAINLASAAVEWWDTWSKDKDPTTIRAVNWDNHYLATHSQGGFYAVLGQNGVEYIVDLSEQFQALHRDPQSSKVYVVGNAYNVLPKRRVLEFDPQDISIEEASALGHTHQIYNWKSKKYVSKSPMALAVLLVVSDNTLELSELLIEEDYRSEYDALAALMKPGSELAFGGAEYLGPPDDITSSCGALGTYRLGVPCRYPRQQNFSSPQQDRTVFRLWCDGALVFDHEITLNEVTAIPLHGKSTVIEVAVDAVQPINRIYLAESIQELKTL